MSEKVKVEFLMDKGKIFISANTIFKLSEREGCDITATLKHHIHQFQNAIDGLPTDGEFELKMYKKRNDPPDVTGETEK